MELTRCDKTDDDCVQLAYDFYQSIGKEAVLLRKECPGFIANRLQLALYREVQDLVMRGVCSVEDVDKALVYGPGIRWAIFGHNMIMQMGNPGGLTGMVEMLGNSGDRWLEDMASWTHQPDNWSAGGPARRGSGDGQLPRLHRPHQCRVHRLPGSDADRHPETP
ncbi:MAG: 3-hydroxyacyl-CoA dehydrogenase family protein [Oscillospiraceae bacterium]